MIQCPTCARTFGSQNAVIQHVRMTHKNPQWTPGKSQPKRMAPMCPICGDPAKISQTRYGARADCCGLWSWDYKDLTDAGTHQARIAAHNAFDCIWKKGGISRGECYRRLAALMQMTSKECHMSIMSMADALAVVELVKSGAVENFQDCAS